MTELTEILANPPAPRSCRFNDWLSTLSEEERVSVKNAMDNPNWETSKLHKVLRANGLTSDRNTVGIHRKKECGICGPV